jgi:hypothetical protein
MGLERAEAVFEPGIPAKREMPGEFRRRAT